MSRGDYYHAGVGRRHGEMEGGMMAARRMVAVQANIPKNHCIEGTAAFLSHYLPPEKGAELVRLLKPGLSDEDIFKITTSVIGGRHSLIHMPEETDMNKVLDQYFVDVQTHKRMGYFTSEYTYSNGSKGAHITAFVWDPETGTVAFFEPREQGATSDRCSFFVRHVDVLKYKAGPGMRGDADGNYRGLFGEYAILNVTNSRGPLSPMFTQSGADVLNHIIREVVIFDTVPKIYEGEAALGSSGAFQEPLKDVKLQENDRRYYTDAQFLESQMILQSKYGNARWNAMSDDERYNNIIRNLMKMYPDILPFEPMTAEEKQQPGWKGWDAESAAAAAAAGAGAAAPMAEVRDEDQIPTPKIDAMEGQGMPQHMARGDYHTSGINRKYQYS
jgi:hypothetical protein